MVKYVNDYYEELYKMFPEVPKSDIKRIVNYGWKQIYLINSYGCDKQTWIDTVYSDIENIYKYYAK